MRYSVRRTRMILGDDTVIDANTNFPSQSPRMAESMASREARCWRWLLLVLRDGSEITHLGS